MTDCLFCKIIKGEIESSKFWEDVDFVAILDLFPNTPGASVVISKEHHESNYLNLEDETLKKFIIAVKNAAANLKTGVGVERVAVAIEGVLVNHLHAKLYPLHSEGELEPAVSDQPFFTDKYLGYFSTHAGPMASREDLDRLADEIKSS